MLHFLCLVYKLIEVWIVFSTLVEKHEIDRCKLFEQISYHALQFCQCKFNPTPTFHYRSLYILLI